MKKTRYLPYLLLCTALVLTACGTQKIPAERPALQATAGGTIVYEGKGSGSWDSGGTYEISCPPALEDQAARLSPTEVQAETAELTFDFPPATVSAACWQWEDGVLKQGKTTVSGDGALALQPGAWIYQITAVWSGTGDGTYVFAIHRK